MIFQFKKFSIKQSASAMKVGTDAVLLGTSTPLSWNESEEGMEILDIGAGTGVLSLMLAQRAPNAKITAIEIDDAAAEECAYNFQNSPFSSRLSCIHSSLGSYLKNHPQTPADLIICNPPFFPGSQAEGGRKKARDSHSLPADELMKSVNQILSSRGQFSLIIPYVDEKRMKDIAKEYELFPFDILRVRGRKESKIIRSILHFRRGKQKLKEEELYIEVERRHEYSDEYLQLVKDFLKLRLES